MSKRTMGLVAAVVLAALATGALMSYVRSLEQKAFEGVETVNVFVAKETIPAGTSGEAAIGRAAIERTAIPKRVVAEGAVASLEELNGKVAAVTILKGEQIVASRFVEPSRARGTLPIPDDKQAMAVEVGTPPGVAGFVQPGDRVSVIARIEVPQSRRTTSNRDEARVQFLLQDVQVLAVGKRVTFTDGDDASGSERGVQQDRVLLTLALSPAEAEKLAFALFEGDVYFTLLPSGQKPVKTAGRTSANAFR